LLTLWMGLSDTLTGFKACTSSWVLTLLACAALADRFRAEHHCQELHCCVPEAACVAACCTGAQPHSNTSGTVTSDPPARHARTCHWLAASSHQPASLSVPACQPPASTRHSTAKPGRTAERAPPWQAGKAAALRRPRMAANTSARASSAEYSAAGRGTSVSVSHSRPSTAPPAATRSRTTTVPTHGGSSPSSCAWRRWSGKSAGAHVLTSLSAAVIALHAPATQPCSARGCSTAS